MKYLFCLFLLIIAGCNFFNKKDTEKEKNKPEVTYNIAVPVTVSKAQKTTLIKYIKANGIAKSKRITDIIAETSGKLDSVYCKDNNYYKKGELLLSLDKRDISLEIENAKIALQKAKAEYDAWKKLNKDISDEQLKIQTGLKQAEINLNKLKLQLEKTHIRMPFDGYITDFSLQSGDFINAGQKLFKAVDNSEMEIHVNLIESEINRIRNGSNVIIRFPSIPKKLYKGKVVSLSPLVDTQNRSCEVVIKIDNDGKIKSGMFAQVKIEAEKYKDRTIIYKDALLVRDGKTLVFYAKNGRASWQYVKTGVRNEYFIEITQGVEPGMDIIIDGNFSLSHDAVIKIEKTVPYRELAEKF